MLTNNTTSGFDIACRLLESYELHHKRAPARWRHQNIPSPIDPSEKCAPPSSCCPSEPRPPLFDHVLWSGIGHAGCVIVRLELGLARFKDEYFVSVQRTLGFNHTLRARKWRPPMSLDGLFKRVNYS